ncbi:MAG: PhoPQ-activated pathogenicity-like protein PqaA type [Planctomycetia bacterium]|nr:PhoPQ-activated pathogenicity-like protein PqaA type [Planctomycetia bacterium]
MIARLRATVSAVFLLAAATVAPALDPPPYILAPDDSFKWAAKTTTPLEGAEVTVLRMTSQTWHETTWRHWIHVVKPAEVKRPGHALLVIAGGNNRKDEPGPASREVALLRDVAIRTGSVIVIVGQVPNQPIFDGKTEDEIIAYTFQRYLETKDETWPALLPMTKSAMRAMDAAQAFLKERYNLSPAKFVVTGASKRGWTTWLTGAFDARVLAIAPMVIDTLNFPQQMALQVESFGEFSEQIKDYTELELPKHMQTDEGKRLVQLIDPYLYRDRLTMPKLLVLGTNDRYWPVDATKLYFPELKGEKYIHEVPNAGHGLGPGVVEAVTAFYLNVVDGKAQPTFDWKTEAAESGAIMRLAAKDAPSKVELWSAASASRDFRDSKWSAVELAGKDGCWEARVDRDGAGWRAFHLRLTYRGPAEQDFALSTNVEVVPPAK